MYDTICPLCSNYDKCTKDPPKDDVCWDFHSDDIEEITVTHEGEEPVTVYTAPEEEPEEDPAPEPPYTVKLTHYPSPDDWMECKRRALVTIGKRPVNPPDQVWKHRILRAGHSPIRWLMFSFDITCPYYVSTHLVRHVHAQPFVRSQRSNPDRGAARQDEQVEMIWDMNAQELMAVAEARLCNKADPLTRAVVREMCRKVEAVYPEFRGLLGPHCCTEGVCREMTSCHNEPFCVDCKHVRMNDLGCPEYCSRFDEGTDPVATCAFWEKANDPN